MQWWIDYFNDVDTMDPERFGAWFADDMQLQFNNAPLIEGKAAVLGFLRELPAPPGATMQARVPRKNHWP